MMRNAYLSLAAKRRRQMGEESEAAAEAPLEPDGGRMAKTAATRARSRRRRMPIWRSARNSC